MASARIKTQGPVSCRGESRRGTPDADLKGGRAECRGLGDRGTLACAASRTRGGGRPCAWEARAQLAAGSSCGLPLRRAELSASKVRLRSPRGSPQDSAPLGPAGSPPGGAGPGLASSPVWTWSSEHRMQWLT